MYILIKVVKESLSLSRIHTGPLLVVLRYYLILVTLQLLPLLGPLLVLS